MAYMDEKEVDWIQSGCVLVTTSLARDLAQLFAMAEAPV
jgi:hypothetical protein